MPQGRLFRVLPASALLLLGALSLIACDPPTPTKKGGDVKTEAGVALPAGTAAGSDSACIELTRSVCERAGAESATCTDFGKTVKLLAPSACAAAIADIEHTYAAIEAAGKACTELTAKLCKDIGPDTETCKMVETETPRMPPEQCEAMAAQYDQVLAELERMEAANKPLDPEKAAKIAAPGAPDFGPADATVTVVAFSDFQCPYCTLAATAMTELKPQYADKSVRFVFRQFPLGFHEQAHLAAQASLAAHAQGKFWEFHDKLFANQKALGREDLEKYAEEIGLDMAEFRKALDDGTYAKAVDADMALGAEVFVSGTPTMFINGAKVANSTDAKSVAAAIDKALGA
jgi:protein-disulfide isomerase